MSSVTLKVFVLSALLFPVCLYGAPSFQPATENVIVLVIDGLRFEDGFGSHPIRCRHLWHDMKPQGTWYTRFYNLGETHTMAGHADMMTGVWQVFPNAKANPAPDSLESMRPESPTIFEYLRKQKGYPLEAAGYVGNKIYHGEGMASLAPDYGTKYRGARWNVIGDDTTVFRQLCEVMDTEHPKLLLVNYNRVDARGHSGDWEQYTGAIQTADSLAWELWKKIQAIPPYSDSSYTDKTTLIVTSDHGRHDDEHGGFRHHGGSCEGCRHVMFLALGPDTPAGVVVDRYADLIDICPTVGELLQIETPYANGEVLSEMLALDGDPRGTADAPGQDLRLTRADGRSIDPDISDYNGVVHLVWANNSPGNYEIYYQRSTDGGRTWSATTQLSSSGREARFPTICADRRGVHVIWTDFRAGTWESWYRRSRDEGRTWESEQRLFGGGWQAANPWTMTLKTDGRGPIGTFTYYERARCLYTEDGRRWRSSGVPDSSHYPFQSDIAMAGDHAYMAWQELYDIGGSRNPRGVVSWDLSFSASADQGRTWSEKLRLTDNPAYSIRPSILASGSDVFCTWADNRGDNWQCYSLKSTDRGRSWHGPWPVTSSGVGAWQPKTLRFGDTVGLAWTEYESPDGSPKIYYRLWDKQQRDWSEPIRLSDEFSFANHPAVSESGYVVWEDYRSGNSEIYFGRIVP